MDTRRLAFNSGFLALILLCCGNEECAGPMDELPTPIIHDIPMERFSPDVAEMIDREWFIKKNCTLETAVHVPLGATAVAILASGSSCEGEWPLLELRLDDTRIGSIRVCSSNWGWYVVSPGTISEGSELRITFLNDRYTGSEDINVYIRKAVFLGA